jgi:AcrR family transcriptional regulator
MPKSTPAATEPRSRTVETRRRAVEAATHVFAHYGYRQASMELIAAQAGMSRQNLYNHFPNKEAMFRAGVEALQALALNAANQAAAACVDRGGDAVDELVAALAARMAAFAEIMRATPHLAELTDEQSRLCGDLVAAGVTAFRATMLERMKLHRAAGALPLPRRVSTSEFVDDAMVLALGLKYSVAQPDARVIAKALDRLLRRLLAGAAA